WALERGVTHFTHWFQPLTGATAEKHDSFLEIGGEGEAIMRFSGKNLIVGEPDASSFPSGGLRSTFEARGYTAWDPTSPAFIKRHSNGATLCIPTAFCSYTGDALDRKTPLLRSIQALRNSVKRLMKNFSAPDSRFEVTLGAEQEYFLIDKQFYMTRPDLLQTGRTLFGAVPPKHQQLEDHYFGSIKPRILTFMTELDQELWKLGIPAKTRHNEAAPAQFEVAPIFEELNLAVDHNMLVMELIRQTAERHGLVALLHEKPFKGVNGSGKHNNWSITYGDRNLLDPGDNPHENAIFLTVLSAVIMAVDKHSDLLRSVTASAGNDHRLGAAEAPPAIISIFLGDQLTDVIHQLEKGGVLSSRASSKMKIGVDTLAPLPKDATDRNRTSPFAFTGNKFEFRAPGSSQSCAGVCMTLNTIVAEAMDSISDELEKFSKESFNEELQKLLQKIIKSHKKIIFNGNNYSDDWRKEAERRGLLNLKTTTEALKVLLSEENAKLFDKYQVLSRTELRSRYDVFLEEYQRKIIIEGKTALEMVSNIILPVVRDEIKKSVDTIVEMKKLSLVSPTGIFAERIEKMAKNFDLMLEEMQALDNALKEENYADIVNRMQALRELVDLLEENVDDRKWPLPKYREMLFIY
ncbi:MAG: glutamine synthetase III, partial [Lentisphaeria bacterium]|nr:glutamine synthetase III [Lentisphaeria bacterium]